MDVGDDDDECDFFYEAASLGESKNHNLFEAVAQWEQ